jgi:hypothetical protein
MSVSVAVTQSERSRAPSSATGEGRERVTLFLAPLSCVPFPEWGEGSEKPKGYQ